ncbi:hypothetical protein BC830DRAFT_1155715 [Chytriomyces sp. MP71]|nr:hypothetical protein BC830DRAFT_1155715 [Chytriomyces sp. MP71]
MLLFSVCLFQLCLCHNYGKKQGEKSLQALTTQLTVNPFTQIHDVSKVYVSLSRLLLCLNLFSVPIQQQFHMLF